MEAPIVLDIEASGFGRDSYPIEVGFVLPSGESRCMLIRPAAHWTHWDAAAERLHQISRECLMQHGLAIRDVVEELNATLYDCTVYTDGWGHDYSWLAALCDVAGRVPTFRLESLRALLDEDEAERWAQTKQPGGHEMGPPAPPARAHSLAPLFLLLPPP